MRNAGPMLWAAFDVNGWNEKSSIRNSTGQMGKQKLCKGVAANHSIPHFNNVDVTVHGTNFYPPVLTISYFKQFLVP